MKILVCGSDGYIGYPLCAALLKKGHEVYGVDCFFRRRLIKESFLESIIPIQDWERRVKRLHRIGDFHSNEINIALEQGLLFKIFDFFRPDGIINLAQQPSAAFSMKSIGNAQFTTDNNVGGVLNILWAMREYVPQSHLITLGTMGEYGFPNMPIPEGFFEINYRDMKDVLPFPRQPGSIYHASKVMSSDLALMLSKIWELRITEINQGVVYGTETGTSVTTRFDVGECFGTMINRAVACAVMGHPITLYGTGDQKRGYIALQDSISALSLASEHPPTDDDSIHGFRVINQMDESYSCGQIAGIVQAVGTIKFNLDITINHITNPRIEPEIHYYKPDHEKLKKMGWRSTQQIEATVEKMFADLLPYKKTLLKYKDKIIPKIKWRPDSVAVKENTDGRQGQVCFKIY